MDRKEKRQIRKRINDLFDSECKKCEKHRRGYDTSSYCVTECSVGIKMQSLMKSLIVDQPEVKEKSPFNTGRWTEDEENYLQGHKHLLKVSQLSERLNRSPQAVYTKLYQMKKRKQQIVYG